MSVKRLTISQRHSHEQYDGPRRWFQVFIHHDVEDLRTAAERYRGRGFANCSACCHPAPTRERYEGGEWISTEPAHWAGVLRFAEGHVTTEVVAHEVTHAALVIYRMDVKAIANLGVGCGEREEQLAYIIGDLIGAASTALHEAGVWS